ncbi:MAG: hypothetical protein R3236_02845 [Phycisphaeraceae bacterium]|nr:hypothetical protein [Phycisphaeraceae bacterium]
MKVVDVNGHVITKGDVVAPLNGDFRGRVSDVKSEDEEGFVCIRPSHRPYSKGIWYASEHVQRLAAARVPAKDKGKGKPKPKSKSKAKTSSKKTVKKKAVGKKKTAGKKKKAAVKKKTAKKTAAKPKSSGKKSKSKKSS